MDHRLHSMIVECATQLKTIHNMRSQQFIGCGLLLVLPSWLILDRVYGIHVVTDRVEYTVIDPLEFIYYMKCTLLPHVDTHYCAY